jgi:hypothetical protein
LSVVDAEETPERGQLLDERADALRQVRRRTEAVSEERISSAVTVDEAIS